MALVSAGLLLYRFGRELEVFLGHPGGPYWANKDEGVWTIPKGTIEPDEDPVAAAHREFFEETGFQPKGPLLPLGSITMKSRKIVHAWAVEGELDPTAAHSNNMEMEWPPYSGKFVTVAELDDFGWFGIGLARQKILLAQRPFLDRLSEALRS